MWTAVDSRKHAVPKIFPFGNNADEFMLYGTVDLTLKNGGSASLEWAGRAKVVKSATDGKLRMSFYQVYLVSTSPLMNDPLMNDAMLADSSLKDTGATNAYKK